ncbi:MAG TPA: hypothetical protein VEL76_15250, partial [Gemmataceae bacterium]|nr:hypothetical protein [Gemmataceae bacterium]
MKPSHPLLFVCAWLLVCPGPAGAVDLDRPPINYSKATPDNAVTALGRKVQSGAVVLKSDENHGYLASLLKHLDIPLSSQVLVFSRTSLQRARIGPKTPRAIYFNDEVTVGFCLRGDVLEIAAADPKIGTAFYTVDQNPAQRGAITRETERCLLCHGSSMNQGFPGHLVRSVSPDRTGEPVFSRGTKRVDHTTPFGDRWGGWYVTGTSGKQTHMGNRLFDKWSEPAATEGTNVTDLKPLFTVANYLTPHSDLVALMVLEHQGEGHNRLARANLLTRLALAEQAELNKALGRPVNERSESITRRIQWACEPLVEYLLFSREAPLEGAVAGTSAFAKEFTARGPFASKRRTLREFDLRSRMFRYPLSYLVYSRSFDGLPAEAKERVYLRLWEVLTGVDQSNQFAHLSPADRQAILEILRETKPGLPLYWKE